MNCPNCGTELPEQAMSCAVCGTVIEERLTPEERARRRWMEKQQERRKNKKKKQAAKQAEELAVPVSVEEETVDSPMTEVIQALVNELDKDAAARNSALKMVLQPVEEKPEEEPTVEEHGQELEQDLPAEETVQKDVPECGEPETKQTTVRVCSLTELLSEPVADEIPEEAEPICPEPEKDDLSEVQSIIPVCARERESKLHTPVREEPREDEHSKLEESVACSESTPQEQTGPQEPEESLPCQPERAESVSAQGTMRFNMAEALATLTEEEADAIPDIRIPEAYARVHYMPQDSMKWAQEAAEDEENDWAGFDPEDADWAEEEETGHPRLVILICIILAVVVVLAMYSVATSDLF